MIDIVLILDGGKEWYLVFYSFLIKFFYVLFIDSLMDIQVKKMIWKKGEWFLLLKVLKVNFYMGGIKVFDVIIGKVVWFWL